MVCYIVPTVAAISHYFARKKVKSWKHSQRQKALNLLLAGGAIFGIVDHLWNGELFLIGPNPAKDILLGFLITLTITAIWAAMVHIETATQESHSTATNA